MATGSSFSAVTPLPSPATTLVIILGASKFPKAKQFLPNPTFLNSAKAMVRYFRNEKRFNLPESNLLSLFDENLQSSEVDYNIASFLQNAAKELPIRAPSGPTDLLVYYVGHGTFSTSGEEYALVLRATVEHNDYYTGYPISMLARTLKEKARGLRRYLILDSCFAGAALAPLQTTPSVIAKKQILEVLPSEGTALLCAASARAPAKAPLSGTYTMFTEALLHVLEHGAPTDSPKLSLLKVGELCQDRLADQHADEAARPEVHSPNQPQGSVATVPLFPNPGWVNTKSAASDELQIESSQITQIVAPALTLYNPWGLVLVANVSDFTVLGFEEQQYVIARLWEFLVGEERLPNNSDVRPTEDGAIVAILGGHGFQHKMIALAKSWAAFMNEGSPSVVLRCALHRGQIIKTPTDHHGQAQIHGTAVNECMRLCSFGGKDLIVVSDDFLSSCQPVPAEVWPPSDKRPIEIMVKPDRAVRIRLLSNPGLPTPEKIIALNTMDVEIRVRLKRVERFFVSFLESCKMKAVRSKVSPRVSLLSIQRRDSHQVLTSTEFRYHPGNDHILPSTTCYEISGSGSGTCGRAFVSNRIKIAIGVPEAALGDPKSTARYVQFWTKNWGLSEPVVLGFSRRSRAVMSIPFGLNSQRPMGVICIDCLHPLTGHGKVEKRYLLDFCKAVQDALGLEFALLWAHRLH